ncbi:hypothetical protein [Rathayibacter sp. VKM Ac-2760]|uniref:hypothetical protein n=1 Tax=Rathayibacter sp. VKM Ac-2760 TaxID=2609253 RepID=UPI0013170F62|nr:hypothetical protein [Rathayibacter sp. VKM Ac-2760]QHC57201.1 hypothetical protein GSU72_00365 [Rathayibacter sp. VKM Ac-2760]
MTKCPSCFSLIGDAAFAWVCTTGRCTQTLDPDATRYANQDVLTGTRYALDRPADARNWTPPAGLECPECKEPMVDACPSCHFDLPQGYRSGHATCIAMNGARATGKSLYIAIVVKQLGELAQRLGTVLQAANDETRRTYARVYEAPLFEERGLMPPTPRSQSADSYQRTPLVYSLGTIRGVRRFVVLRDVAGEEMEEPPTRAGHLAFLRNADSIFFMFDPLAVPSVRDKLVDVIPAQQGSEVNPLTVLNNLITMNGGRLSRLAVVLSKFDAVQRLSEVEDVAWSSVMSNAGSTMLREPDQSDAGYDAVDGGLLHEEVKSLLYAMNAGPIVLTLENPHEGGPIDHRFFAVSALGESPDGQQLNPRGIAPFRCLDPLKWTLARTGVLA